MFSFVDTRKFFKIREFVTNQFTSYFSKFHQFKNKHKIIIKESS